MAYIYYNANPFHKNVEDCVIRAIATATDRSWEAVFDDLSYQASLMKDLPNSNQVWGSYLEHIGFTRYSLRNTCPLCYTVRDFCYDNPQGVFVVGDGSHAIAVIDGNYIDTYDSGDRNVLIVFKKGE